MNKWKHVVGWSVVRQRAVLASLIVVVALDSGCHHADCRQHANSAGAPSVQLGRPSEAAVESAQGSDEVKARRIVLRDSKGKDRAVLELVGADEVPTLSFFSSDGLETASIWADDRGGRLQLVDRKNKVRTIVDGATIRIVDEKDLALVRLAFERSGGAESSSMSVQTSDGAPFVSIGALRQGPSSVIMSGEGGKGNVIITIENGAPLIHLRDNAGNTVLKRPE